MTPSENGQHDRPRDLGFERAFTATAAGQVGHNPTSITRLAEQRAPLEPVRGLVSGRDLGMDGMEEGSDWRNYICWHAMHIDHLGRRDPLAREARAALGRALGAVVIGFHEHHLAREVLAQPIRGAA
jgi:hypothetical protein